MLNEHSFLSPIFPSVPGSAPPEEPSWESGLRHLPTPFSMPGSRASWARQVPGCVPPPDSALGFRRQSFHKCQQVSEPGKSEKEPEALWGTPTPQFVRLPLHLCYVKEDMETSKSQPRLQELTGGGGTEEQRKERWSHRREGAGGRGSGETPRGERGRTLGRARPEAAGSGERRQRA